MTATVYAYQAASGRLSTVTDPKVTTYTYALDDAVIGIAYTNAVIATPGVTYRYDPVYNRVTTMVDGTGTTSYAYQPPGSLGAGQVASVDGPLTDDTITYTYDELGRVVSRAVNGAANTTTQVYDALGRVTSETNVLGTFTYAYVGVTGRLQLVTYPNGQTSEYLYYPTVHDERLQTIHHKRPGGATLSKFDYTYDAVGNIVTWQQQGDSDAPTVWTYGYDRADQLTSAVHQTTGGTPSIIKRYAYTYDPAGNRTSEQIDDAVTLAAHDNMNRLLTDAPGGPLVFKGALNEPGRVTVNDVPALVSPANQFEASVPVGAGTNTVTINAVDASGNTAEAVYEMDQAAASKTFTYDPNGNMTSDGTRTFEWNARNQLAAVNLGPHRSEFRYDGHSRRVEVVEKEGSVVTKNSMLIWCATRVCTVRAGEGSQSAVLFAGESRDGVARYFAADHLDSVAVVTDGLGDVISRTTYDPFGRSTSQFADLSIPKGFTGHVSDSGTALSLAPYREYDPEFGRWLSPDPIGVAGGLNLYRYALNRPTSAVDPLGLQSIGGVPPGNGGVPPGCSAGPWRYVGTDDKSEGQCYKYRFVGSFSPQIPSRMKKSIRGHLCSCTYERAYIVDTIRRYNVYKRAVQCCSSKFDEEKPVYIGTDKIENPILGGGRVTTLGLWNPGYHGCNCTLGMPDDSCARR